MRTPAPTPHSARAVQRAALASVSLTAFLTPFMGSAVNVALPPIGRAFALDAISLSWVATAYLLAAAALLVPLGKLGDIRGRRRMFAAGVVVHTAASALCALAPTAPLLIAARGLQGAGSAMVFGTGVAILTSVHPPGERGRALGLNVAAVYLGLSLGPALGGFLTDQWGWRAIFWAGTALGIVTAAVVFGRLRGEWADARGERFDTAGALLYTGAMTALIRGLTLLPGPLGLALSSGGVAGLALFGARALRVTHPLLEMSLWRRNRVYALSSLAALINYSATSAVGFLLSLHLQYVKGLPAREAGLVLVAQPAVMALLSPLAGRWSDRVAPRTLASLGMGVIAAGLLVLAGLQAETSLGAIVALLLWLGVGFALFSSPNTNAVMGAVAPRHYGLAGATLATMRLTGQAFSLGLAMLIFALRLGPVAITPERHGDFLAAQRAAFSLFALLCVAGIFASLARGGRDAGAHAPRSHS